MAAEVSATQQTVVEAGGCVACVLDCVQVIGGKKEDQVENSILIVNLQKLL